MARRSSYASVLAGSAGGPARSGFLSHPSGQHPTTSQHHRSPSSPQPGSRTFQSYGPFTGSSNLDTDDLPAYSSSPAASTMPPKQPLFFIPSYLKHSRHAEKLEEKHKARLKAQRDGTGRSTGGGGGLSRTTSGVSLHKMVPSHRGMTYDIQERFIPPDEEILAPLPTRWNAHDKFEGLELSADGWEVTLASQVKPAPQDEAAAIRADHPMPAPCGIYYYEVTILTKSKEAAIGVGFSGPKASLHRLPGWEPGSWAYHGDDGFGFSQTCSGKHYGPKFGLGDIIGCGINFSSGEVFFTNNGINLGCAFKGVSSERFFPSVGMKKPGDRIKVNFGQEPFVYDINGFVERERDTLQQHITREPFKQLHESRNETILMQELVGQYLAHEGYSNTTESFTREVRQSKSLLEGVLPAEITHPVYREDSTAQARQSIRSEVLRGEIDAAIKHTNAHFPSVLPTNEDILFRLKCRKFIEMIKQSADLAGPPRRISPRSKRNSSAASRGSYASYSQTRSRSRADTGANGHGTGGAENVFSNTGQMDIDSDAPVVTETGSTEQDKTSARQQDLSLSALIYGRELTHEYKSDPRREVQDALKETFALIAYEDAREGNLAYLLEEEGRVGVAEELNAAILVSLGQSSTAALERLVQQADVFLQDLGFNAQLLNIRKDYLR